MFLSRSILTVIAFYYSFMESGAGKGGKAATKAGLTGITQQIDRSTDGNVASSHSSDNSVSSEHAMSVDNPMKQLKHDLMIKRGYDKGIRPAKNYTEAISVDIDFTYMQVLNLNEKDQILRSLLRFRLYWKDEYLVWKPENYDGITDITLPSHSLWMPDIVCDEEIGAKDISPRIPYVAVNHDGHVSYLEPVSYETTCAIDIANFPFDRQVCVFTFTSWSQPTSRLDLMSRRSSKEIANDIPAYFVPTGEWKLRNISVIKKSEYYGSVLTDLEDDEFHDHGYEMEHGNKFNTDKGTQSDTQKLDKATALLYFMNSKKKVQDEAPERVTDLHWSEIVFTLKFQRNSSLYVQSMIFPAILLTTISLLGFYLPPDSGERVGLQVTILLTFMVFILTVGDMFPASSGPYLGVYFVLCMALLGINIWMTILVLHLHHMPCAAIMAEEPTGITRVKMRAVPYWIRMALILFGVHRDLFKYSINEDCSESSGGEESAKKGRKSALESIRTKCKKLAKSFSKSVGASNEQVNTLSYPQSTHVENRCKNQEQDPTDSQAFADYITMDRSTLNNVILPSAIRNLPNSEDKPETLEKDKMHQLPKSTNCPLSSSAHLKQLYEEVLSDITNLSTNISAIASQVSYHGNDLKDNKKGEAMEEKWKAVARRVDARCMYTYIFLLFIFHLGILLGILFNL